MTCKDLTCHRSIMGRLSEQSEIKKEKKKGVGGNCNIGHSLGV